MIFLKRLKKASTIALLILSLLISGYLVFLCFPQIVFPYRYQQDNIHLYADKALSPAWRQVIRLTQEQIKQSDCFNSGEVYQVFFCKNPRLFRFIAFLQPRAAGLNNALFNGNTFIRTPNEAKNQILDRQGRVVKNNRTLSNTIAHEITHAMLARKTGRWRYLNSKRWIIEGYCDFIGMPPVAKERREHLIRLYLDGKIKRVGDWYDLYHVAVECYLSEEGLDIGELIRKDIPREEGIANWIENSR